jgi:molecular chaperone GrpE
MSGKKHEKPQPENVNETQAGMNESAPVDGDQTNLEFEALRNRLEELEAKSAEYLDGWQRSQAEFSNYRKRVERDNELMRGSMKGDIFKRILPAIDDLDRALQNRPPEAEAWVNGIELIYRKLASTLEAEGLTRIEAVGQPFDPNFHEAIGQEPSDEHESGTVIEVVQQGYLLGERVIRPALVKVAQ